MTTPRARDRGNEGEKAIRSFVLEDLGVHSTVDDFVETFRGVVDYTVTNPEPADAAAEFSAEERAALERAGAKFSALPDGTPDPVEQMRIAFGAIATDSVSVEDTADALARDQSRIRQRIRERSLWSIPGERGARLPRVQFDQRDSKLVEIPGMGRVLQALPLDLHPVALLRWLTRPKPDLEVDGVALSPRDWLRGGGQVDEAVALAEDLHVS